MDKQFIFIIILCFTCFCKADKTDSTHDNNNGGINIKYSYSRGINFIPLASYDNYDKLSQDHISTLDKILSKKLSIKNQLSPQEIYDLNQSLKKGKKNTKWKLTEKVFKNRDSAPQENDFLAFPLKYQSLCPNLYDIPKQVNSTKGKASQTARIAHEAKDLHLTQLKQNIEDQYPLLKKQVDALYNRNIYFTRGVKYLLEELHYLNAHWHELCACYNKNIISSLNLNAEVGLKYSFDSHLKELNSNKKFVLNLEVKNPLIDLGNYCIFLSGKSGIKFEKDFSANESSLQLELSAPGVMKEDKFLQKASHNLILGYVFDKGSNGYLQLGSSYIWDFTQNFKVLIQQYLRYPISSVKTIEDDQGEIMRKFLLRNDFIALSCLKVFKNCILEFGVIFSRNAPRFQVWDAKYKDAVLFTKKLKDDNILYHQWNKDLFTSVSCGFRCNVSFLI